MSLFFLLIVIRFCYFNLPPTPAPFSKIIIFKFSLDSDSSIDMSTKKEKFGLKFLKHNLKIDIK